MSTPEKNSESKNKSVKSREGPQNVLLKDDVKEKSGPASESVVVVKGFISDFMTHFKNSIPLDWAQ